jgi:Double-GTPase 2
MPKCTEEGCLAATTGKCINNLEIDNCPHYSIDDPQEPDLTLENPENDASNSEKQNFDAQTIDVYSGSALNLTEANKLAASSLTRFIILAGLPDAGKTTILLSLLHLFETNESYGNYLFAGSRTLLDFEEKSHPSKIDSDKSVASTARTLIGPPKFLHIKVARSINPLAQTDLLFTDISGELFIALKDSNEEAAKFTITKRADHFCLFFDSDLISSVKQRAEARASGIGIIRSLYEAGTLLRHTRIQVIFSRWDLFSGKTDQEKHLEFLGVLKADISRQFGNLFQIDFYEVSARPKNEVLAFGFGIENLFPVWVEKSILNANRIENTESVNSGKERQFLQYRVIK